MTSRMLSVIFPAAVVLCLAVSSRAGAAPRIAAYYDGGMPVSGIPAAQIDDLIYAFGEPSDAGACAPPTAAQEGTFAALRELRQRHPGLRLIASIGGWDAAPQYSDIALTDRSRGRFAASCVQTFVVEQGFDGIDLDWEFPVHGGMNRSRPEDRADATALVREFRRQLDALGRKRHRRYLLTVATPAGTWQQGGAYSVGDSYDLGALARAVDWLNVMTYDMNNIFSPVSGFNAPLDADPRDAAPAPQRSRDNLTGAVRYYESHGVPAAKIMLGVAFYGRGFTGVSPRNAGLYSKYTGGYDETPWKIIRSRLLTSPDWVRHWSATAQAPWLYNASQRIFFTYDDPLSLGIKADFARRQRLRGVMIWVLGEDDPGNCLLNALASHLATDGSQQHARN
ncbi:MAG TPA: glycoside hydrolase family 18 protein [Steroidobacteraceae bacterium]|nr:glycoside hydrolase family 18 protein [Steroidobacteraceae bacterium]